MECIRGDPDIYFRNTKGFKLPERKKCIERNNLCTENVDVVSAQTRINTIKTSFMKQGKKECMK